MYVNITFSNSPQHCIDTSIVFMHRFYLFHPIQMFPADVVAAAALSLGCKAEHRVHITEIINTMVSMRMQLNLEVNQFYQQVYIVENFLTSTLDCYFNSFLPNQYINDACNYLRIKDVNMKSSIEFIASNR